MTTTDWLQGAFVLIAFVLEIRWLNSDLWPRWWLLWEW